MRQAEERRLREAIEALARDALQGPSGDPAHDGPRVLCFSGHMIDAPGRQPPRFPPEWEDRVKQSIARELDRLRAAIGFSSAACGADLLFLEAMKARGAETHVVLPFASELFLATSVVRQDAPSWKGRFEEALASAATVAVTVSGVEPGEPLGFELGNLQLIELAFQSARDSRRAIRPMVVWDRKGGGGLGGTSSFCDLWSSLGFTPEVVELGPVGSAAAEPIASVR